MRTLDDLTPYYQERMRFLSPQQRKIIDFLCDRRQAVTVKEIAQRCFMTHQTASSQLKKLLEMGYVRSEPIGRESYYELREPLMRFCLEVKKQRGEPIQLFVDFLRLWYTQGELQQRLRRLPLDAALEREYVRQALRATEDDDEDPRVAAYWKGYKVYIKKKDFANALQVTEKLVVVRGHAQDWFAKGYCLYLLECYDEALAGFDKVIELNSNKVLAWSLRAFVLYELQRQEEAIASFDKVIELNPNDELAWGGRGAILALLRNYDEALVSFDKSIELNPNDALAWGIRGAILTQLGNYDEALVSLDNSIELNPNDELAWRRRGAILAQLRNYDEALVSLNKSIKLDPKDALAWYIRGLIMTLLGWDEEAITSWDKAIALSYQSSDVFFNRVEALLVLNRWDEGIAALDDALNRFAHANEPDTDDTQAIIRNLFKSTHDAVIWRSRITSLIALYDKHQVISALGQGLVRSIPALMSEMVSDKAAQTWLEVWRELVSDRPEFQIPLRLLNTAVRYRQTKGDKRVLLELPIEERKLLKPLLGIEKP
jgi:tetratricopeptide (TPR) repeat protein